VCMCVWVCVDAGVCAQKQDVGHFLLGLLHAEGKLLNRASGESAQRRVLAPVRAIMVAYRVRQRDLLEEFPDPPSGSAGDDHPSVDDQVWTSTSSSTSSSLASSSSSSSSSTETHVHRWRHGVLPWVSGWRRRRLASLTWLPSSSDGPSI
jgi:hypothetical protein